MLLSKDRFPTTRIQREDMDDASDGVLFWTLPGLESPIHHPSDLIALAQTTYQEAEPIVQLKKSKGEGICCLYPFRSYPGLQELSQLFVGPWKRPGLLP